MTKLISVKQVRNLWPNPKPTELAIKRLAKSTGCCRKLGRAVGFTEKDVEQLLACCGSTAIVKVHFGTSVAPLPDEDFAKALALATKGKRKRTEEKGTQNSTKPLNLNEFLRPLGAKR